MDNFFAYVCLTSILAMIIGMVKPQIVTWWSLKQKRSDVLKFYCCGIVASALGGGALRKPNNPAGIFMVVAAWLFWFTYWNKIRKRHKRKETNSDMAHTTSVVQETQLLLVGNESPRKQEPHFDIEQIESSNHELISTENHFAPKIKGFPSIPFEIAELIWFMDGPLKNYDASNVGYKEEIGYGLHLHMYMTTDIEPSAVSTQLDIRKPKNLLFVEPTGYFPQYGSLTPEQRWKYLHWLTDIDTTTDLGYVFLYYYGLERHLFLGEFEKAFKTILRLRKFHTTSSFPAYSLNALLASLLFHQRPDLYAFLEMSLAETGEMITSDLHLYVKYLLHKHLAIPEIISMASHVGFTNSRYIKAEYETFYSVLSEKLYDYYAAPSMPLDDIDIEHCPQGKVGIVANTSLNPRSISIQSFPNTETYRQKY